MSVDISPIGGAAAQFFDNNGVILSGGKLYTYAAGTTTPKTSYTNVAGVTPHSNPIILDSAGRVPGGEIWLTSGEPYKFVLETPTSILLGTWDNIYGYTSGSAAASTEVQIATAGQTLFVLTSMAYNPGANTLGVFIDGVNQVVGNSYVETNATSVTFMSGLHVGAVVKFINLNIASTQADVIIYNPGFVGSVTTTVADKLEQYVSVKDFGAVGDWNGTQSTPGTGTDDTAAIQAALDYCVANGATLFFPQGRYRTTAPLVIDKTPYTNDPINGDMSGIAIQGASARSAQIVADHDGVCLDYQGALSAGIHSYFNISGVGLLKANYNRAAGSIGLKLNLCAYFSINRFDIYGFEYGIYGIDCLSGSFEDGTIRGNSHGFYFIKGVSSWPNNISFRGVMTLNNFITGGTLFRPSVFSYIGGSIENNGFTGILADPNSWGLYVESAGTEGSVGVNMQGVYIEGNNGIADVWIQQNINTVIHNFNGCSFLRYQNTRYVTSCIRLNSVNDTRLSINGCGFKDYSPYVADPSRPWIATGNAQVFDGGGNLFFDPSGGFTGLARAVFAPIASNHQLPFASLPSVTEFRNGIQYCSDGSGAGKPSLAVSDGTTWWQMVLGQFAGNVSSVGAAQALPKGWTCVKSATGVYVITHNLNLPSNSYAVTAVPRGASGLGFCSGWTLSGDTFEIYFSNQAGVLTDMDFSFMMSII